MLTWKCIQKKANIRDKIGGLVDKRIQKIYDINVEEDLNLKAMIAATVGKVRRPSEELDIPPMDLQIRKSSSAELDIGPIGEIKSEKNEHTKRVSESNNDN
mmetsp:Transcript_33663/g.30552  ORF Transcript_33663/g.30552 Transcript_33663/m.30552 type:complete len:101 (+) Transcript_33663:83-385(+)